MAIRERGSSWQVSVTIAGKRYRKDFPNRPLALQAEAEAEIAARGPIPCPPPWAIPRAADELTPAATWQDVLDAAKRSAWARSRTGDKMVSCAQTIINAIGPQTRPSALNADSLETLVEGWLDAGNTGSTVNRKLSILRTLCMRAARKLPDWKVPAMPWEKENAQRLRYYSRDEEARMVAWFRQADEHAMADLVLVALDTGGRRGELLALTAQRIVDDGHSVKLTTHKGGEKSRTVPLTARAKAILMRRADIARGGKLFPLTAHRVGHLWDRMRDFLEFGDEEDFVFHCLRHTYASRLVQAGVQLQVVKDLMGHANIQMTMRYAHLAPDNLRAAVAALEAAGTGTTVCPNVSVVPALAA